MRRHLPSIICAVVGPGVGAWKCETVGDTDDGVPGVDDITSAFFISSGAFSLMSLECPSCLKHCRVYNTNIWDMIPEDSWWMVSWWIASGRGCSREIEEEEIWKKWKYIRKMAYLVELMMNSVGPKPCIGGMNR